MNIDHSYKFDSAYFSAFVLVVLAGLLWSFGAPTVRYMIDGHDYVFHYLFYRGISIAVILIVYLLIREGLSFYKNFFKVGIPGVLGGIFLSTAFIGFIFSITMTTAAVTLFMLAAMPFIAAIVSYFVLGEVLRPLTLVSMIIAFIGVSVMILNDSISGSIIGAIIGLMSATGFALYTVTIRWKPETPKFTTVVLAGIFCAIFSFFILGFSFKSFASMPTINAYLSLLHGSLVASGLILYSIGAKYLPSAELALLSLMEVVGGVIWVWMPVFGINEVPSTTVIIGGLIITFAVLLHGFSARRKREPVTL
ncbi:DMT family transporter [Alphaproteobacteria bacterium]|nr:DMT family transporter [Alphaproteobacteria bacterium]